MFKSQQYYLVACIASLTYLVVNYFLWWESSSMVLGMLSAIMMLCVYLFLWLGSIMLRTQYPRWVYILLWVVLLLLGLLRWYNHQWLLLSMFCFWIISFFDAKVWVFVWLWYAIYAIISKTYWYVEVSYVLVPYMYTYVTVWTIIRILSRYFLQKHI